MAAVEKVDEYFRYDDFETATMSELDTAICLSAKPAKIKMEYQNEAAARLRQYAEYLARILEPRI